MRQYLVLKLESFQGEDTFLNCGNEEQDYLYCVVLVDAHGSAEIIDNGYRSAVEALEAWPEAGLNPRESLSNS